MLNSFYQYVQRINEEGPPPPPGGDAGGAPPPGGDPSAAGGAPPGGDPMAGLGGGGGMGGGADPMGGGAGGGAQAPRAAIKVTTVWDAIRNVLGKDAEHKDGVKKPHHGNNAPKKDAPKPKSLMQ